jgi:hypothetical protein
MPRHSRLRDAILRPMITSGLTATMLIFASTVHAQGVIGEDGLKQKGVIGEEGVKQKGIIGEEGLKKAGQAHEIVKAPDGNFYRLTPAQLKGIAKEGDPDKPCKIKDCLIISAYGQKLIVPVTSLSKFKISASLANDQIKAGSAPPLAAQWEPPAAP